MSASCQSDTSTKLLKSTHSRNSTTGFPSCTNSHPPQREGVRSSAEHSDSKKTYVLIIKQDEEAPFDGQFAKFENLNIKPQETLKQNITYINTDGGSSAPIILKEEIDEVPSLTPSQVQTTQDGKFGCLTQKHSTFKSPAPMAKHSQITASRVVESDASLSSAINLLHKSNTDVNNDLCPSPSLVSLHVGDKFVTLQNFIVSPQTPESHSQLPGFIHKSLPPKHKVTSLPKQTKTVVSSGVYSITSDTSPLATSTPVSQSCSSKPFSLSGKELLKDSGISLSISSPDVTVPSPRDKQFNSDAEATCSSWTVSEDSNHLTSDLKSPALQNDNCDAPKDDPNGEKLLKDEGLLDTSLSSMQWLGGYALNTQSFSHHLLQPVSVQPTSVMPFISHFQKTNTYYCSRHEHRSKLKLYNPYEIQQVNLEYGLSRRPPFSYMSLIQMALSSQPSQRMKLKEICQWIEQHFPYYKYAARPGWKNSIRHNLSLYPCFMRDEKSKKNGGYWTLNVDQCRTSDSKVHYNFNRTDSTIVGFSGTGFMQHSAYSSPPTISAQQTFSRHRQHGLTPILPRPSTCQTFALVPLNSMPPSALHMPGQGPIIVHIPTTVSSTTTTSPVGHNTAMLMSNITSKLAVPPCSQGTSSVTSLAMEIDKIEMAKSSISKRYLKKKRTLQVSNNKNHLKSVTKVVGNKEQPLTKGLNLVQQAWLEANKGTSDGSFKIKRTAFSSFSSVLSPTLKSEEASYDTVSDRLTCGTASHSSVLPPILAKRSKPLASGLPRPKIFSTQLDQKPVPVQVISNEQLLSKGHSRRKQVYPKQHYEKDLMDDSSDEEMVMSSNATCKHMSCVSEKTFSADMVNSSESRKSSPLLVSPNLGFLTLPPFPSIDQKESDENELESVKLGSRDSVQDSQPKKSLHAGVYVEPNTSTPVRKQRIPLEHLPSPIGGMTPQQLSPLDNSFLDNLNDIFVSPQPSKEGYFPSHSSPYRRPYHFSQTSTGGNSMPELKTPPGTSAGQLQAGKQDSSLGQWCEARTASSSTSETTTGQSLSNFLGDIDSRLMDDIEEPPSFNFSMQHFSFNPSPPLDQHGNSSQQPEADSNINYFLNPLLAQNHQQDLNPSLFGAQSKSNPDPFSQQSVDSKLYPFLERQHVQEHAGRQVTSLEHQVSSLDGLCLPGQYISHHRQQQAVQHTPGHILRPENRLNYNNNHHTFVFSQLSQTDASQKQFSVFDRSPNHPKSHLEQYSAGGNINHPKSHLEQYSAGENINQQQSRHQLYSDMNLLPPFASGPCRSCLQNKENIHFFDRPHDCSGKCVFHKSRNCHSDMDQKDFHVHLSSAQHGSMVFSHQKS